MNGSYTLNSNSVTDTFNLGVCIGRATVPGDIIGLCGHLGAGKTVLAKGIAAGLQVPDNTIVNSPTFVLINEYQGRVRMFHVDAYRLNQPDELAALGFEEMCSNGGIVVIEWAEKVKDLLPNDHLHVEIQGMEPSQRLIRLAAGGIRSCEFVMQIRRHHEQAQRPKSGRA